MKFQLIFIIASLTLLSVSSCSTEVQNDADRFLILKDSTKDAISKKEFVGTWKFLRSHALRDLCFNDCRTQIEKIRVRLDENGIQFKDTKILTIDNDSISILKNGEGHFYDDIMPSSYSIREDGDESYFVVFDSSKANAKSLRIFLLKNNKLIISKILGENYMADEYYR